MKRLSQSGSSTFCPELRFFLISQSYFSNFALHMINSNIYVIRIDFHFLIAEDNQEDHYINKNGPKMNLEERHN